MKDGANPQPVYQSRLHTISAQSPVRPFQATVIYNRYIVKQSMRTTMTQLPTSSSFIVFPLIIALLKNTFRFSLTYLKQFVCHKRRTGRAQTPARVVFYSAFVVFSALFGVIVKGGMAFCGTVEASVAYMNGRGSTIGARDPHALTPRQCAE
jgi:hypothetical protein